MKLLLAAGSAAAPRATVWIHEVLRGYGVEVAQTVTGAADCLAAARRRQTDLTVVHHSLGAEAAVELVGRLTAELASLATVVAAPSAGAAVWLERSGRAGALELLLEDDTPLGMVRTLARAQAAQLSGRVELRRSALTAEHAGAAPARRAAGQGARPPAGRRVVVARAKGGAGATFVAANLAALWWRQGLAVPLLVDLAVPFGSVPAAIGAAAGPPRSLAALLPVLSELNRVKIEGQLRQGNPGLRVLGLPDDPDDLARIGPGEIKALLGAVRRAYPEAVTIVDAPLYPRPLLDAVVDDGEAVASAVVLVSTAELPALAATRRLARQLRDDLHLRPGHDLHLVVNQVDQEAHRDERGAAPGDWPPLATLPRDLPLVTGLVEQGAPVPEGAEPLYGRLRELSRSLWQLLEDRQP
jgi:Flp pilus assembly CpaE family ATPase